MKPKNRLYLQISLYTGLIAFVGGWLIFFIWAGARYFAALDIETLELIGFFWLTGFFWLNIGALFLLAIHILSNRENLNLKMLYAGVCILINIPSVMIILPWHSRIEDKVFVKLINQSEHEITSIKLYGSYSAWNIGELSKSSSIVFNYEPEYSTNDARSYQKPDTLRLIISHSNTTDTIGFPTIDMGECKHLILDKGMEVHSP